MGLKPSNRRASCGGMSSWPRWSPAFSSSAMSARSLMTNIARTRTGGRCGRLLKQDASPMPFVPDLQDLCAGIEHRAGGGFERALPGFEQRCVEDRIETRKLQFPS